MKTIPILLIITLLCLTSRVSAEKATTRIRVETTSGRVRIVVLSTQKLEWKAEHRTSPESIVLLISPVDKDPNILKEIPVNIGLVKRIKFSYLGENKLQINVSVVSLPQYKITETDGKKGLSLTIERELIGHPGVAKRDSEADGNIGRYDVSSPELQKLAIFFDCLRSSERKTVEPYFQAAPEGRFIKSFNIMLEASKQTSHGAARPPIEDTLDRSLKDNLSIVINATSSGKGNSGSSTGSRKGSAKDLIEKDFRNTEIVKILRFLAEKLGLNLITSTNIREKKSIALSEMTAEEAIPLVLRDTPYSYRISENTLFVGPRGIIDSLAPDAISSGLVEEVIRVFVLKSIRIEKLIPELEQEFPGIKIEPKPALNAIVVTSEASRIKKIEEFIRGKDSQGRQ